MAESAISLAELVTGLPGVVADLVATFSIFALVGAEEISELWELGNMEAHGGKIFCPVSVWMDVILTLPTISRFLG